MSFDFVWRPTARLLTGSLLALALPAGAGGDATFREFGGVGGWGDSTLQNLLVSNFGDLRLGRAVQTLTRPVPGAEVIYTIAAEADGTLWAGGGPGRDGNGILLRIDTGQDRDVRVIEVPDAGQILSILPRGDGVVLLGVGGEHGGVLRVEVGDDDVSVRRLLDEPTVDYVWRLADAGDGRLLVATGPHAQLWELDADGNGNPRLQFEAEGEVNLPALAVGSDAIYVGSEPGGVVWRVSRDDQTARVLLDVPEPEVSALVLDGETLYVVTAGEGTADAVPTADARPVPVGPSDVLRGDPAEVPAAPDLPPDAPDSIPMDEIPGPRPDDGPQTPEEVPEATPDASSDDGPAGHAAPAAPPGPGGFGPVDAPTGAGGSGVYRLDVGARADAARISGAVSGVLRGDGTFYDAAVQDGRLLVVAGPPADDARGRIFEIDVSGGDATTALLTVREAAHVTRLVPLPDGRAGLALSSPGLVAELSAAYEGRGTLTGPVVDAGSVSRFGTVRLQGLLPDDTSMLVRFRSGNAADPETGAAAWSDWTDPQPARQFVSAGVPDGRYLQFRVEFSSAGSQTPLLEQVRLVWQLPNLPPTISELTVADETLGQPVRAIVSRAIVDNSAPSPIRTVDWQASDPNGDRLTFEVQVRRNRTGEFRTVASGLTEPGFAFDPRAGGNGVYEVRVVADDAPSNPPGQGLRAVRTSAPFTVDLTPPQIGDFEVTRDGESAVVAFRVVDRGGIVARVDVHVDGVDGDPSTPRAWRRAFPVDGIADSPEEAFRVDLADLPDREVTVRLRAVDDSGNLAYQSVLLPAE